MRILALGPIHGGTIAQRIQQMSREGLQVQQGSLYNLGARRISWGTITIGHIDRA